MEKHFNSRETLISNATLVEKIIDLVNTHSNDQELGKKIRSFINSNTESLNSEYLDNSHEKGY